MSTSISLASGLYLDDPWDLLKPMRQEPGWYEVYDGVVGAFEDNELGIQEITLSIMLGSGVRANSALELFNRRHLARQTVLSWRENIKLKTIELRRRLHHPFAAKTSTQMNQILS